MNPASKRNFFAELKRRNVYKVAVAYVVVAWVLIQAASILLPTFEAPLWVMKAFVALIAAGFPIALVIAWAFEMTPTGLKRTESISHDEIAQLPYWSRRKFAAFVITLALLALALLAFQLLRPGPEPVAPADARTNTKSVAVLPFENRSEDKANAWFTDGIQDEILTRLAKIEDLKVISRTSTQRYKSSAENIPEIARQLGVAHILEGGVQKAGERVRVNVQLIRADTDGHVWAEVYDRQLTDIFAVQSDIAENIARALQAKLSPREQRAVAAKPTDNPAAYESYLRGLALWNTLASSPQLLNDTVAHFARAVELDPKFAEAWSRLSVTHTMIYAEVERTAKRAASAKEALERAKALEAELGDVTFAEGLYRYRVLRDFPGALESLQRARRQGASEVEALEFMAYVKRRQRKWDEAVRLHEEALQLDPRNPPLLSEAAVTYRALRRFRETDALLDRAREIEPDNVELLAQKVESALAQGDPDAARRYLEPLTVDATQPTVVNAWLNYYNFARQFPEAIHMLRPLLAANASPRLTPQYRARLGIAESFAGNSAAAETALIQARDELLALRAEGDTSLTLADAMVTICAFLKAKACVDREASALRDEIATDALIGPLLERTIAAARAQLGETDAAITLLRELLNKPGEDAITPALLRLDPRWDPLRADPRFQELAQVTR